MKKITYLFALVISIASLSCSSDDDGASVELSNQITLDGSTIDITSAVAEDYGGSSSYYNYDFTFSGTLDQTEYSIYVELFSPVIENNVVFRNGVFTFSEDRPSEPSFYFEAADVTIGTDDFFATAGRVEVSGSDNAWVITGELTLNDDRKVTFEYSGDYTNDN